MHYPVMVVTEKKPDPYCDRIADILLPYRYDETGDEGELDPVVKFDYMCHGPGRWGALLNGLRYCRLKNFPMIRNTDTDDDLKRKFPKLYSFWLKEKAENGTSIYESALDYFYCRFCFVLVTPDGRWHEPGQFAWWLGALAEEEPDIDWAEEFGKMLDSFPGTYWITLIDCHI